MVVPWTRSYTRMQIKFSSPPAEEEDIGDIWWTVRTTARFLLRPRSEMWPPKGEKESCVSHRHLTRGQSCPEANVGWLMRGMAYAKLEANGLNKKLTLEIAYTCIHLFRKRLSEKVHATIPKGIVGGFEITVLHRNFERMAREAVDYVCEC